MSTSTQTEGTATDQGARKFTRQYLTFLLDSEEYGVDILRVQEIKGWEKATLIPNVPDYVKGVMNLRGTIVPVIDLRQRFQLTSREYGPTTVVIVLKVVSEQGERTMGIVVDAVSDVYHVGAEHTRPAPDFGGAVDAKFVNGLATVNEQLVILLDIDRLVEAGVLGQASGAQNVLQ